MIRGNDFMAKDSLYDLILIWLGTTSYLEPNVDYITHLSYITRGNNHKKYINL